VVAIVIALLGGASLIISRAGSDRAPDAPSGFFH